MPSFHVPKCEMIYRISYIYWETDCFHMFICQDSTIMNKLHVPYISDILNTTQNNYLSTSQANILFWLFDQFNDCLPTIGPEGAHSAILDGLHMWDPYNWTHKDPALSIYIGLDVGAIQPVQCRPMPTQYQCSPDLTHMGPALTYWLGISNTEHKVWFDSRQRLVRCTTKKSCCFHVASMHLWAGTATVTVEANW